MPACPSPSNDFVSLQLNDAGVGIGFCCPGDWSRDVVRETTTGPFHDAEGRLHPRLTATSPDGELHIYVCVSRFEPPSLVSAVVYWAQLLGFESTPENDERWHEFQALGGWSSLTVDPARLVGAAWMQAHGTTIEFRLEGPVTARTRMQALWTELRESFACESRHVEPSADAPLPWSTQAKALQAQGLLDEALALIERDGDVAEASLMQADLHAARMRRALEVGDRDAARDAWRKAAACAHSYASSATSGGEGAARSLTRDRVLADLGPEPHA